MSKSTTFTRRSGIQKRNGIMPCICLAPLMPLYRVKFCPVVSAENILIEIALRVHVVVRHISSNISGCTGPIFAIFSPSESALRADDGSVPHSPICQGMLPWQPSNFAVLKVN